MGILAVHRNWHINELGIVPYLWNFDGFPLRRHFPLTDHGDVDNFVDELQLDEPARFFVDSLGRWNLLLHNHGHFAHLVNVLKLGNLDALDYLVDSLIVAFLCPFILVILGFSTSTESLAGLVI